MFYGNFDINAYEARYQASKSAYESKVDSVSVEAYDGVRTSRSVKRLPPPLNAVLLAGLYYTYD